MGESIIGGCIMGFFDGSLFDFNGDRKTDIFETFVEMQMMAGSRQEAIDFTGDDTFYERTDEIEELEEAGLNYEEVEIMDEDERREALEDAGLDIEEFGEMTIEYDYESLVW